MWRRVFAAQVALTSLALVGICALDRVGGHRGIVWLHGLAVLALAVATAAPLTWWVVDPGRAGARVERILERVLPRCPPPGAEGAQPPGPDEVVKTFFLADVAHQLRTELQLLQIRLERLGAQVPASAAPIHDRAMKDVERLHDTLTEHLELARMIEPSRPVEVDMCQVVMERVQAWSDVAARRDVEIVATPRAGAVILTRHGVLEQLLDILLDNAIKHSPPAGTIAVSVLGGAREATLQVLDAGPGMTPEERARATERGWRGGEADGDGRGLGLAIAGMLVGAGGGRLTLAPGPRSRGADVRCTFPLADRAPHAGA